MLGKAFALAYKDLQLEFNNKTMFSSLVFLSWLFLFLGSFGLRYVPATKTASSVIIIWLVFVFIATIVLNKSLSLEKENGCWEGLLICPIPAQVVFTGKFTYNSLLILGVEVITIPLSMMLFGSALPLTVFLPIILCTFGFTGVGLLFALASLNTEGRDVAFSVVTMPLFLPLFFIGIHASVKLSSGSTVIETWPFLTALVAYDVIFIAAAMFLFDTGGKEFE